MWLHYTTSPKVHLLLLSQIPLEKFWNIGKLSVSDDKYKILHNSNLCLKVQILSIDNKCQLFSLKWVSFLEFTKKVHARYPSLNNHNLSVMLTKIMFHEKSSSASKWNNHTSAFTWTTNLLPYSVEMLYAYFPRYPTE